MRANLIKFDDITDKEKLKNLEKAANKEQFDKKNIFNFYQKIPFDLNTLINAEKYILLSMEQTQEP